MYSLDYILSTGWSYPFFEQPGPEEYTCQGKIECCSPEMVQNLKLENYLSGPVESFSRHLALLSASFERSRSPTRVPVLVLKVSSGDMLVLDKSTTSRSRSARLCVSAFMAQFSKV